MLQTSVIDTVDGRTFVVETVYPDTAENWRTSEELQAYLDAEFPARGAVTVSYDPVEPSRAAIILRGNYGTSITLAICGLVVLIGLLAMRIASR